VASVPPDESVTWIDGPWTHRTVSAGGTRFHAAELGDGPLVLFLHGFPQFWWCWRRQLVSVAEAGYRAVAMDLRGYGGSDKPPRGYDLVTLAGDAARVVRALGAANATIVGHAWGGLLGWTMSVLHTKLVQSLVVVSAPHPRRLRKAVLTRPRHQAKAIRYVAGSQLPMWPERRLVADDASLVADLLHRWSGPKWPDPQSEQTYRKAIQIPGVAHCSLESYRWLIRSIPRPDGIRYARHMRGRVEVPTLQVHGALDTCMPPRVAQGSGRYVRRRPYRWRLIDGAGHFPHEERAAAFDSELIGWLGDSAFHD
jgi:pimeloyl-ACP methyl ester carboxylesterase